MNCVVKRTASVLEANTNSEPKKAASPTLPNKREPVRRSPRFFSHIRNSRATRRDPEDGDRRLERFSFGFGFGFGLEACSFGKRALEDADLFAGFGDTIFAAAVPSGLDLVG